MQMCDGLPHNLPRGLEVILGNCLVLGGHELLNVFDEFPEQCRHVLEAFREVYRSDATTKEEGMSPKERWSHHQANSGPVMDELKKWLAAQFAERKVGRTDDSARPPLPAEALAAADAFPPQARRPTGQQSVCEQALKRATIHRKNSLFYKTETGARVGDTFMSLIHTPSSVAPTLRLDLAPRKWTPR